MWAIVASAGLVGKALFVCFGAMMAFLLALDLGRLKFTVCLLFVFGLVCCVLFVACLLVVVCLLVVCLVVCVHHNT